MVEMFQGLREFGLDLKNVAYVTKRN
jgi:hypothetical protein